LVLSPDDPTNIKHARTGPRRVDERPCLEFVRGRSEGRIVWLESASTVLGRAEDADVPLTDDGVSRRHAKVILAPDGIVNLKDLGSTNGTFVNGAPIDATVLREGDRIQLGPEVTLRFAYGRPEVEPVATARPIEVTARELEIARLVAEGLTNAEIGKRLHISRHTVVSHVSKVLEKAEVGTRGGLATLVAAGRIVGPS
jgi:DNA-binding CsgD family transcriptional regulator